MNQNLGMDCSHLRVEHYALLLAPSEVKHIHAVTGNHAEEIAGIKVH